MSKDEIARIKADIVKSGLPCEIDISTKLRSAGWTVIPQDEYVDEDTGKPRAIDIVAFKWLEESLQVHLTIECSKSVKPWVFYGSWKVSKHPTVTPHTARRSQFSPSA